MGKLVGRESDPTHVRTPARAPIVNIAGRVSNVDRHTLHFDIRTSHFALSCALLTWLLFSVTTPAFGSAVHLGTVCQAANSASGSTFSCVFNTTVSINTTLLLPV